MLHESEEASIPSYIDITPSVIIPKSILCEIQPVAIDDAVHDKILDNRVTVIRRANVNVRKITSKTSR